MPREWQGNKDEIRNAEEFGSSFLFEDRSSEGSLEYKVTPAISNAPTAFLLWMMRAVNCKVNE